MKTFKEAEKAIRKMVMIVEELKEDMKRAKRIDNQREILRALLEKISQRDMDYIA